jgi:Ca2+-binding EF-hand superfamily protein
LKYDKDKKGFFTINDLKRISKDLGEKIDDVILDEMIKRIDSNLDGQVTLEDFYNAMTKKSF